MVADLDITKQLYYAMPYYTILYHKIRSHTIYHIPNTLNSYNSVIFQTKCLKFCIVVDRDNTSKLYHAIPYHNIPSHTKYQIFQTVIIQSFFKLGVQNFLF